MDKQQLMQYLQETLKENAMFDISFEAERPAEILSYADCGNDHNGFAVIKPDSIATSGELTISYKA